jgi:hypothetical protein
MYSVRLQSEFVVGLFFAALYSGDDQVVELDRRPSGASKAGSNESRFETLKGFFVGFFYLFGSLVTCPFFSLVNRRLV